MAKELPPARAPSRVRSVEANGLVQNVLEWDPAALPSPAAPPAPVFLVHGYMDAAGTWDRVAPLLAAAGHRVFAPDMRGFGDGPRAPRGSYYHFADYVADLAGVVDALSPSAPVILVGHSMGGTITTLLAGAFPERVIRLASLEGVGPPDNPFELGPIRMRRWIDGVREVHRRGAPEPIGPDEARRRLAGNHAGVAPEVLEERLHHLTRPTGGADARLRWRYDPLHRTTSPVPFFARLFVEFARQVTCPVLFVSGGPTGFHPPDGDERLAAFPRIERVEVAGAGHMLHWTRPEELGALLVRFFSDGDLMDR